MPRGVYPRPAQGIARRIDYLEAQRLRDEGVPVFWIARRLGCSVWSIYRATDGGRRIAYERERRLA